MNHVVTRLLVFYLLILFSCNKNDQKPVSSILTLEINSAVIYADGLDELMIKVKDEKGADITNSSEIYIDNILQSSPIFKTNSAKTFTIFAKYNNLTTAEITFKAIRHENNNFTRKVVIEEFAGMWCGFCPRFTNLIEQAAGNDLRIIPVTIHSGDVLEYVFQQQMRNKFGISSFPSAYINRALHWDESYEMITNELNKRSKLGIALNTTINGNTINITANIKFDISTSEELNIVAVLTEDSLIYPQANYYNTTFGSPFYNAGNPILNYRHNNTLRKAFTDIFGDKIPITVQKKGKTWEKTFTVDASNFNINNSKIVCYVQFAQNTTSRWGVLNAQTVKAGNKIDFD